MLRTPVAPAQPATATSGSRSAARTLRAEAGVVDLDVLVDEHERLEVVARARPRRAAGCSCGRSRRPRRTRTIAEPGSAARLMPGARVAAVGLRVVDGGAEGDHRRSSCGRARAAAAARSCARRCCRASRRARARAPRRACSSSAGVGDRARGVALGLGAQRPLAPAFPRRCRSRACGRPISRRRAMCACDPLVGVGDHLQRAVVDRAEVGGHDLAPCLAHLEAEVEVVAVEVRRATRRSGGCATAHGESASRKPSSVSTSPRLRVRGRVLPGPGERREVAAAVLRVAVDERRERHRRPPTRRCCARRSRRRSRRRPRRGRRAPRAASAQKSASTISASWWTSTSASRSVVRGGARRAARCSCAKIEPTARGGVDGRVGLGRAPDARLRRSARKTSGLGDGRAERDHRERRTSVSA